MEQGIPGAQNEPFFELLHPNVPNRGQSSSFPPHPPSQNGPASANDNLSASSSSSSSALDSVAPSYDFQLSHYPKTGDGRSKADDFAPPAQHAGYPMPSASFNHEHQAQFTSDPNQGLDYNKVGEERQAYKIDYGKTGEERQAYTFDYGKVDERRGFNYQKAEEERRGFDLHKAEEERQTYNPAMVTAVDNAMKSYTDRVLAVLDNMKGRLSNLESTVQGLENSIERLKLAEEDKQNDNNSRLLRLENLIKEVHARIQLVHDKQMVDEAKSQLSQMQATNDKVAVVQTPLSDAWQPPKEEAPSHVPPPEPPTQSAPQHGPPRYSPQVPAPYPHPPPPPPQQVPQTINEPNKPNMQQPYPPATPQVPPGAGQPVPPPPPQASMPMTSYQYQQPPPPQGSYNPPSDTVAPYGQHMPPQPQPQPHQHHPPATTSPTPPPPPPPTSGYMPEPPHYPPGSYAAPQRQHPVQQDGLHASQQHVPNVPQQMYEPHGRMGGPNPMPPQYAQSHPPPPVPPAYEQPPYGTPPYRAAQPVPSAPSGGSGGYPRIPTAQPVHSALPAVPLGSSSHRSQSDEVTEKVVAMGFSRDQVRAVMRNLTDSGQPVELNVVLDKLMNGGGDSHQPPRGWFARG